MKPTIILFISLFTVLTLSACGIQNRPNVPQQPSQNQENSATTTTEAALNSTSNDGPFFLPLYSEFHMGNLLKESLIFPTVSNKIENVHVKVYKVDRDHFVTLLRQHSGWANHEGRLDISNLSSKEKKPFFDGQVKIHETGKVTKIARDSVQSGPPGERSEMNGYIEIPMIQPDYTVFNQGYYYFEFESPESSEAKILNSLLEITETRASVSYEEQYPTK